MFPRILLAAFVVAFACTAQAGGEVYRWVDDQGRTQFGDSVPERYARVARRIDTSGTEVTERDRGAAEARRQQLRDAADAVDAKARETAARRQGPDAADAQSGGGAVFIIDDLPKRPEPACRAKVRAFEESLNCFAPYRNANGTIQPEGLARCKNAPVPPPCR